MKLTHISNTSCIYESQGFKLLVNPWLTDGLLSRYHYPPLATTSETLGDIDAIYSYDQLIDDQLLSKLKPNILKRGNQSVGPFDLTAYNSETLVIESNGKVAINATGTLSLDDAKKLYWAHGAFDLVQLKDYNENVTGDVKAAINRQLSAMCVVARELRADWLQPLSADFFYGGKLGYLNRALPFPAKQYSAAFIADKNIKPLILNEGGSLDLITGELKAAYRQIVPPFQAWLNRIEKLDD